MTRRLFTHRVAEKHYRQAENAMSRLPKRGLNKQQNIKVVKRYKAASRALSAAALTLFYVDDIWM